MKTKEFRDDVYGGIVTALHGTPKEINHWLMEQEMDFEVADEYFGVTFSHDDGTVSIWINDPQDFRTIVHESIHVAKHLFKNRGISLDLSGEDEHFAYYVDHWASTLWDFFSKFKGNK